MRASGRGPQVPEPILVSSKRQRMLREQADQAMERLAEPGTALGSDALLEEAAAQNRRLRVEIDLLRDQYASDWARGLTDVPPPSYPFSNTESSNQF